LLLGLLLLPLALFYAGEFPGHVDPDQIVIVDNALQGKIEPWLSPTHTILLTAWYRVSGLLSAYWMLPALAAAVAFVCILHDTRSAGKARLAAWAAVGAWLLLIPIWAGLTFVSQDITAACLKLCLAALLVRAWARRAQHPGLSKRWVWGASVLLVLIVLHRRETLLLALAFPLLCAFLKFVGVRRAVVWSLLLGAVCWGVRGPIERALMPKEYYEWGRDQDYQATSYAATLGYMVKHGYASRDYEADKRAIEKFFGLEKLRGDYNPLRLTGYYWGNARGPHAPGEIAELRKVYINAARNNLAAYLGHRVMVTVACFADPWRYLCVYPHREDLDDAALFTIHVPLARKYGLIPDRGRRDLLARASRTLRDESEPGIGRGGLGWIWNGLPWLGVVLLSAALWRKRPLAAACAGIVLCTFPVIFLLAPEAQFKYVVDYTLMGVVLLPVLACGGRSDVPASGRAAQG
jgi:hypothetical protein